MINLSMPPNYIFDTSGMITRERSQPSNQNRNPTAANIRVQESEAKASQYLNNSSLLATKCTHHDQRGPINTLDARGPNQHPRPPTNPTPRSQCIDRKSTRLNSSHLGISY